MTKEEYFQASSREINRWNDLLRQAGEEHKKLVVQMNPKEIGDLWAARHREYTEKLHALWNEYWESVKRDL